MTTVVLFWPLHAYVRVQELKNSHAFSQITHTKGSWGSSWKELTFFSFIVSESWFPGEYTWQSQPCRCALGFSGQKGGYHPPLEATSQREHWQQLGTLDLRNGDTHLVVCIWLPDIHILRNKNDLNVRMIGEEGVFAMGRGKTKTKQFQLFHSSSSLGPHYKQIVSLQWRITIPLSSYSETLGGKYGRCWVEGKWDREWKEESIEPIKRKVDWERWL